MVYNGATIVESLCMVNKGANTVVSMIHVNGANKARANWRNSEEVEGPLN